MDAIVATPTHVEATGSRAVERVECGEMIADEAAVAEALNTGHLAGYGCDVFAEEPAGPDNPILTAPNTILTPHSAAMTPQGMRRMGMIGLQNVLDCFDGCLKPEMIFNRKELGL